MAGKKSWKHITILQFGKPCVEPLIINLSIILLSIVIAVPFPF